jgi:hypothetical protein
LQIKTKIVSSHIADSKPVKQEVNGTVILPPLVFPAQSKENSITQIYKRVNNLSTLFLNKLVSFCML